MFRRFAFALALGAMFFGHADEVREMKAPNSYEHYMRQLERARDGLDFVYVTAEGCGPCRALHRYLENEVKGNPAYAEWDIIPLELNMYNVSDRFPEAGFAEREAALRAVNDRLGVLLSHDFIPKYVVAVDGNASGWGAEADASDSHLTLGFAPLFDSADENVIPVSAGEARDCLAEAVGIERYGRASFPVGEALSCVYNSASYAEESLEEGRAVTASALNKGQLENCISSAGSDGHVTGAAAIHCLLEESIGNNPVTLEYVLKNPASAIDLSRLPARVFREETEM